MKRLGWILRAGLWKQIHCSMIYRPSQATSLGLLPAIHQRNGAWFYGSLLFSPFQCHLRSEAASKSARCVEQSSFSVLKKNNSLSVVLVATNHPQMKNQRSLSQFPKVLPKRIHAHPPPLSSHAHTCIFYPINKDTHSHQLIYLLKIDTQREDMIKWNNFSEFWSSRQKPVICISVGVRSRVQKQGRIGVLR